MNLVQQSPQRLARPDARAAKAARPAPVRILMYTAYFAPQYSGAALQALTLARELRRRGHQVAFITNRWSGLAETEVVEGFPVQRLTAGNLSKHREFRLWFNMTRHVARHRNDFDILHSHGAYYTHAFIGPLARVLGLRSLVKASLSNDDLHGLNHGTLAGRLHRAMLSQVGAYVAISQDLVDEFKHGGLPVERIHHVPNGVDVARFCPASTDEVQALRQRLQLPADRPVVLYLGVLDQRKNIRWLAEQWVAQQGFGTRALLLAVGPQARDDAGGALRAHLAELALQNPQHFALQDFCPDVIPYLKSANVLVLPSSNEGLPNVVLEAMACGLPCVAASASGSRELIADGQTGFNYSPGNVGELGQALQQCLSPAGLAMGQKARATAVERFSIESVADRYESLYAQLLQGGRSA